MNIKILDSWLREFLDTKATPKQVADILSLTSVSVERLEKVGSDYSYDIEVTTNRPELMSVVGLAREATAALKQSGIEAKFIAPKLPVIAISDEGATRQSLTIENDDKLVNRVLAIVMDVDIKKSPDWLTKRLEATDIRSLNNVIDVTNYVMLTIGHPTHVFDYDRLVDHKIIIRPSKKGEKITTLDNKTYELQGNDIVAEDGSGKIIDLLGIMGLENSVVNDNTKRIVFFLDNLSPTHVRKTSMFHGIRTEAAQLNEKGIDANLAYEAFLYGIALYKQIANGKVVSKPIDIYPNKEKEKTVTVTEEKINSLIGVTIPLKKSAQILKDLGFGVVEQNDSLKVTIPTIRNRDINDEEDLVEEIARIYGYHNLPNELPPLTKVETQNPMNTPFYWEMRAKLALKYWGFTEVYTYSMVSEAMFEGPVQNALVLSNPLSEDQMYMRNSLVPSLLEVVADNKSYDTIKIFEIANVYHKKQNALPDEVFMLAGVIKKEHVSFYEIKGIVEQLLTDLGIIDYLFKPSTTVGVGADVVIDRKRVGDIEVLGDNIVNFELNFEEIIAHASHKRTFTPLAKYPPIVEDLAIIVDDNVLTGDLISTIENESSLIKEVTLLDKYRDTRTFHIIYQSKEKNLTSEDVKDSREKIIKVLRDKYKAELKI